MSAVKKRLGPTKARVCQTCGSSLEPESRRKYDTFWVFLLICLGAATAFYLVGLFIIGIGLWLWTRRQVRWVCPTCSRENAAAGAS